MNTNEAPIAGVARAAMLTSLSINTYSGRKKDTRTQAEVTAAKGAHSKRAASVYKSLFADCVELEDITKFQARVRAIHYNLTLPWSDSGPRLLPTKALQEYQDQLTKLEAEFWVLVRRFLDRFDLLVAAAAFQLGALFNRAEYPTRESVEQQFGFSVAFSPLPLSGDFRLDIESEVQADLIKHYNKQTQLQLEQVNSEAWTRLHKVLSHMSDRLTVTMDEEGKPVRKKIYDSMVENAQELCGLLTALNVTGDPKLEQARAELEGALSGVIAKDFRDSDGARTMVKSKVDKIMSDYNEWLGTEKFDD